MLLFTDLRVLQLLIYSLTLPASAGNAAPDSSGKGATDDKAEAIRAAYDHAWKAYFKCAYKSDTADVLRCTGLNDRGGWGATIIDNIDTSLIMNLTDTANLQIDFALGVDFSTVGNTKGNLGTISAFETTIRILGGLLSATDLLEHGYGDSVPDYKPKAFLLLMQAKTLADTLDPIWNTTSRLPAKRLNLHTKPGTIEPLASGPINSVAGIGTSQLEYARLSHLTGQPIYVNRSVAAVEQLFNPRSSPGLKQMLPGLVGYNFDVETGLMMTDHGSWGGGADSYYEYLLKMSVYDPISYARFLDQYKLAARSTRDHLLSHPRGLGNVTFLAAYEGSTPRYVTGHLACFAGGSFLQSRDPEFKQMGENLIAGCHHAYASTATGLAPELWHWQDDKDTIPDKSDAPRPEESQYFKQHGFWADQEAQYYALRPEVLESYFIAWRITHEQKYRDWAWDAFLAINASCYAQHGYAGVADVTSRNPRNDTLLTELGLNTMDSFFLSETLKYAYLIFQDDDVIPLEDWVLTTEGHPLRILAKDDVDHSKAIECLSPKGCDDWPQIPWNQVWLQSSLRERNDVLTMLTSRLM